MRKKYMITTQKDMEDYVYAEVNQNLSHLIGTQLSNKSQQYFDYIAKNIESQLTQLVPIATSPPDIKISISETDSTIINIKIIPKQYQYSFNYNVFPISNENLNTHNFGAEIYASYKYSSKCKTCNYGINKDANGYYSYIGDFSCDEYIIKDIIE